MKKMELTDVDTLEEVEKIKKEWIYPEELEVLNLHEKDWNITGHNYRVIGYYYE